MKKISFLFCLVCMTVLNAQRDFSKAKITSEKLSDNIYALFGEGGNIGLGQK